MQETKLYHLFIKWYVKYKPYITILQFFNILRKLKHLFLPFDEQAVKMTVIIITLAAKMIIRDLLTKKIKIL